MYCMLKFQEMGIKPEILKAIEKMGFIEPTEVQSRAIPNILNKKDMIVMSKTGSGKTAVFGIPILQIVDSNAAEPQALILTPTRELAVQIDNDIRDMSAFLTHKTAAVYGQHNIKAEINKLNNGVSIVTGTPGRVYDHISRRTLNTKSIRFLVIDEADRMLDMGFIDQVRKIIKTIPKQRITLLFSATIPTEIKRICSAYMNNPEYIEIESDTMTVDTITQVYYRTERNKKCDLLYRLLCFYRPESCLIFSNTRVGTEMVNKALTRKGLSSRALHGDISQGRRIQTVQQFKKGMFNILVATDVAARGIHIEDLSLVVNFDIPEDKDSYVHRIGRTGRAGKSGQAVSIVTTNDIMGLYEIEEHIGVMINEADLPITVSEKDKEAVAKWLEINKINEKQAGINSKKPYKKTLDKRKGNKSTDYKSGLRTNKNKNINYQNKNNIKRSQIPDKKTDNEVKNIKIKTEIAKNTKKTVLPNDNNSKQKGFLSKFFSRLKGKE